MSSNALSEIRKLLASSTFLLIFASFLVISISIAYVASERPHEQRFLTVSTMGSNMQTKDYFPSKSTINVGESMNWYISVYNRMGSAEYVSVKVRLLNSTQSTHDNAFLQTMVLQPSMKDSVYERNHMLANDSTWTFPLSWTIKQIDKTGNIVIIRNIIVNGTEIDGLNVQSQNGDDFRIVVELWRYDSEINDFVFGWNTELGKRTAWNQIWFNVR